MADKNLNQNQPDAEETSFNLALYGAAGSLGQQIIVACEGEGIALETLIPVGSRLSIASDISYQGKSWKVQTPGSIQPSNLDAAVVATPQESATELIQTLASSGIFTIDASGASHERFPLVWTVNNYDDAIDEAGGVTIPGPIASTVFPVLKKLADVGSIASLNIVALMTAGSQGKAGPPTLSSQTLDLLNFRIPEVSELDGLLAFNLLPVNGSDSEHERSRTRRELTSLVPNIQPEQIQVQCLRVPVFSGIACALHVEFAEPLPESAFATSTTSQNEIVVGIPKAGLRESLEADTVLVSSIEQPTNRSISCICFADPLHRTASTVGKMLQLFAQEGL